MTWLIWIGIILGLLLIASGFKNYLGPRSFGDAISAPVEILAGVIILLITYIWYLHE